MTTSTKRILLGAGAVIALAAAPINAYAAPDPEVPIRVAVPTASASQEAPAPASPKSERSASPSARPTEASGEGIAQSGSAPSAKAPTSSGPDAPPQTPTARGQRTEAELTTIPEIQKPGVADDSALIGTTVTTLGVVTGAHPRNEDGLATTLDGFTIQTPGTGGAWDPARASSDGLFAWVGKRSLDIPEIGSCVRVTGTVGEYPATGKKTPASTQSLTQLAVTAIEHASGCAPVTPTPLESVPSADQLEALESMLVTPQGTWTITDNYQVSQYGTLALTPGTEPLRAATDIVAPGEKAAAYEAASAAAVIALDDGTNTNLTRDAATGVPYAYIANGAPARVGYHAAFTQPVLVDVRHSAFVLQPTRMTAGHPERSPIAITGERPAVPEVEGDIKVATFNVLNYFSDLGEDEPGCKGYPDRQGNLLTAKNCTVRGAWSSAAFAQQQAKIVAALSAIDADVVALEEIENPVAVGVGEDRDATLKTLVTALNTAAGSEKWAYVPSPAKVPAKEDVIRTAFIYQPKTIAPVGGSVILDDPAFTDLARQPLAQEFTPVVTEQQIGRSIVVIANHFKSKGSVPTGMEEGNTDTGDGQGNSNAIRVAQAKALALFAERFEKTPTLLVGDFNSYSKEDPLTVLTEAGWIHKSAEARPSYVYSGRSGSLDHVFANAAADPLVRGVASWGVNAEESIAFEYSRSNMNAHLATEIDNPYRSSDHNPEIVGLDLVSERPQDGGQTIVPETPDTRSAPALTSPSGGKASAKAPGSLANTGVAGGTIVTAGAALCLGAVLTLRRRLLES
ncbi:Uncharacterized protein conserved in bacteria [Actinomyces bovis]|uniref:Uncharacterized protein conserved in bacteria n=1 Tax=Actinomyces bovis TaxID=1658 RepID=A0ABY1VSN5_9ACTO|nr:ExeM/NucH family extracellular endonuclease [Actinomyces bovis]SPT54417.1 Uncharacterized protein conserved in bacteria [Actinomyces bovis]VEG56000.1 Uncharacterized protein conserved in bacteria [Actinomyces israelii]